MVHRGVLSGLWRAFLLDLGSGGGLFQKVEVRMGGVILSGFVEVLS